MLENAKWLAAEGIDSPEFICRFHLTEMPASAKLEITTLGVYKATLNGARVGNFELAPGWTVYRERVQVQDYDVLPLLTDRDNELVVKVGGGWYNGAIARVPYRIPELIAELTLTYADGRVETVASNELWRAREGGTKYSDIYNGETYDASAPIGDEIAVKIMDGAHPALVPQQGEKVVTVETLAPVEFITTPKGEQVVDFGQEITGIVRLSTCAPRGTKITLNCAEMLDADGNFYTENYRDAKSEMNYICGGSDETWQPELTFYGFRYIKVSGVELDKIELRAVVLCSELTRVGRLDSGVPKLNRLFSNIIWGQKGNFLDIPTDCPQRNERLGWTGDAQVFANTACWQFDVKKFFTKWLEDVKIEQRPNGAIPSVVPCPWSSPTNLNEKASTAWGETATVCPWQVYRHYGDVELLRSHFDMMKGWVDYMGSVTDDANLWTGYQKRQGHYGDWLGLDAKEGSYVGASDVDLIASAFYYYSTGLVVEAGKALGEDVSEYEALRARILVAFRERFPEYVTQTECVLALHFGLAAEPTKVTEKLVSLIEERGNTLTTGFVGTPYLLYALAENGRTDVAYSLLLQEKFPSWLFSVNSGATTIWEHWDGRKPDGSFWSADMNSFNHYAYGSVASWVFEVAAGITPLEPGFAKVRIAPTPDERLGWLRAEHETSDGLISSAWFCENGRVRYEISTPVPAVVVIDGVEHDVAAGSYLF